MQGFAERSDELVRTQARLLLEHGDDRLARLRGNRARLLHFGRGEAARRDHGAHWMLPASSKIGKYIITTTVPMTAPMNSISTGSKTFANQSTQRAISSS